MYSTAMRCIPKERLVEITKHLHGNRDKGFEEEYQVCMHSMYVRYICTARILIWLDDSCGHRGVIACLTLQSFL